MRNSHRTIFQSRRIRMAATQVDYESKESSYVYSREQEASRIINKYTGWAAGSGAIPFPVWDIAAMASVQVKMLKSLLDLYEVPFSETKVRSIVGVLVGSVCPQLLAGATAGSLAKFVPGIGHVLASISLPALGAASCYALGKVMLSHLEEGGDLSNFDTNSAKGTFRKEFEKGKEKAKSSVRATSKTTEAS